MDPLIQEMTSLYTVSQSTRGQSTILNELGTTKMEGAVWMLAGGATIGSTAIGKLSSIPYSTAVTTLLIITAESYSVEAG